jgi:hypothetical protein
MRNDIFVNILTEFQLLQPADKIRPNNNGKQQRGEQCPDRPESNIAEYVEYNAIRA